MQKTHNQAANKLLVIKCGGSIINNEAELNNMFRDLVKLKALDYAIVLLHGGGPDINRLCNLFKLESTFSNGLRITTPEILDVTQMALLGKTNAGLVYKLNQSQIMSVGLSGHDANLLVGTFVDKASFGYVGNVHQVNSKFLYSLLNLGIMPVIAPLAIDGYGNTLNINADLAASAVARALNASQLILLSDIDGYYANYPDKDSLIKELSCEEVSLLLATPNQVADGMQPKLTACLHAVSGGVDLAHIINGNHPGSLFQSVQNPAEIGTRVLQRVIS